MENICYLGLGSNLGYRLIYLRLAVSFLSAVRGLKLLRASSVYETQPVGYVKQGIFYNAVLKVKTALPPEVLLRVLKNIERVLGRSETGVRWGPRVIDIDIILYGRRVVNSPGLSVPHKELYNRYFWLEPISEIEKGGFDFFSKKSWSELKNKSAAQKYGCKKIFPPCLLLQTRRGGAPK